MKYFLVPALMLSVTFLFGAPAWAKCGQGTETSLTANKTEGLVCHDALKGMDLQLKMFSMCGTHSGTQQTVVFVEDKRGRDVNRRWQIYEKRMAGEIARKAKGKSEYELFSAKVLPPRGSEGEEGYMKATGVVSDGKVSKIKLEIRPTSATKDEDICTEEVDLSKVWVNKKW